MSIPETTSAEGLERFVRGTCLFHSRGPAWQKVTAWILELPVSIDSLQLPSVSEPFIAWTISGVIDFEEREYRHAWIKNRISKGSFFLTSGGAPYETRWKAITPEPFTAMLVFIELPLLQRALREVFVNDCEHIQLRDVSGFTDVILDSLMERLQDELIRDQGSPLFVEGIAQSIAIHLARNYAEVEAHRSGGPSLPGYKLRQITDWMGANVAADLNLDELAAQSGLSKFHFHRLFKRALGVSPAHYQLKLRMDEARRLLRETSRSVVNVALDVGYTNPSHFAKLFRRETGLAPSDYRRQR